MSNDSIAFQVLSDWGAQVEPVQTSAKKESDWLATLDGFRLLVEEKTKLENPLTAADRKRAFVGGEVHGTTTALRKR